MRNCDGLFAKSNDLKSSIVMQPTFTAASDNQISDMVASATHRLVVVLPACSSAVATAIALRMDDLPNLSLTVILDADPEVYRMGYGEVDALDILRKASAQASFRLREQIGVRIGVIISDDQTLIYAPLSANIEAGSTSDEKPNGIFLGGDVADKLAEKAGASRTSEQDHQAEIGRETLSHQRVTEVQEDLKRTPPLPVDLTRKLNVFITRVQYVELKAKGYQLSRRRAELPSDFVGMANGDLKDRVTGRIRTPLDGVGKLEVTIKIGEKEETLKVDEKFLQSERSAIEKALTHVMPKRGRVILRKDRESFDHQIERFKMIVAAYQTALAEKLEDAREDFQKSFIDEFLKRWVETPPDRFMRRLEMVTEEQLKEDIEAEADKLFDQIVKLDGPDVSVIYKDIAIEDLRDESFLQTLKEVMTKGGVKPVDLIKLFEQGEAAAGQNSFNLDENRK
tara:strand:- start:19004 stop:20362 length:1359 start_codon:yes stop_codon:yes gene_type:complete